jgi:hypothetical protein
MKTILKHPFGAFFEIHDLKKEGSISAINAYQPRQKGALPPHPQDI